MSTIVQCLRWCRHRADRREKTHEQRDGCGVSALSAASYTGLPDGRSRTAEIQKDIPGLDFMYGLAFYRLQRQGHIG